MKAYIDIVRNILDNGIPKKPVRKQGKNVVEVTDTIGLPNQIFSHNMADGFPLLTTKKVSLKNVAVELEGFLRGITNKKWYEERNCFIWRQWYNQKGYNINDLGPIYGRQWRKFDEHYEYYSAIFDKILAYIPILRYTRKKNGLSQGKDQLKEIIFKLKSHPYDRRMVSSAWNPNQLDIMSLPACHLGFNVCVYQDQINLAWWQRSCDLMLGVPYNIASYALLLLLLAKTSGFKPGNLTGLLVDCHIYTNQIDGAREQITREPYDLPQVEITIHDPFDISAEDGSPKLVKWTHKDLNLVKYQHHPSIVFPLTV